MKAIVRPSQLNGSKKKCAVCGKVFFAPDEDVWVFKRVTKKRHEQVKANFFCSWHCLRKWDSQFPGMVMSEKITEMIKAGKTDEEIRKELGIKQGKIDRNYRRNYSECETELKKGR